MNIKQIIVDWSAGLTHGAVKTKHNLTDEQEYAITVCSSGLSITQIEARVQELRRGMSAHEIEAVMQER